MQQGRVIQSTGSWYEVMLHNSAIISCRLKGKFRLQESKFTNPIAVGDEVIVDSDEDGSSVITEILPRKIISFVRQHIKQIINILLLPTLIRF